MKGRLLLFGGSFNPIHNGHLAAARYCRDELGFARVIFVPNGDAYPKPGLAAAPIRLEMVRAAIADEPRFEVYDAEVFSAARMRVVQTAWEVRERYPDAPISVFRGLDALHKTHRDHFEIPELRILVVDREGVDLDFEAIVRRKRHLQANRDRIDYFARGFQDPLSATALREGSVGLREGVPGAVYAIIRDRGLYGEA